MIGDMKEVFLISVIVFCLQWINEHLCQAEAYIDVDGNLFIVPVLIVK